MTKANTPGASAPERVTARHPFFFCNPTDQLFEVRPGLPVGDAIDIASAVLSAAGDAANHACEENDSAKNPHSMWAAAYLIEMARAAVQACAQALVDERKRHV